MSARRTVDEIRHQLRLYPSRTVVEFSDSLINGDVRRLGELASLLTEYRVERLVTHPKMSFGWTGQAILHSTMTFPLLQSLRRSGCAGLRFGLESGSQKVVDLMQKNFAVADAEQVVRDTHRAGINTQVYLLIGFPGETERDFQASLDFLERNAAFLDAVGVSSLEVQKGSFLDLHAREHGVRLPLTDRSRWATADGDNTWEVREDRVRRAHETAERLGLITNRTLNRSRTGDFFLA